jgi:very-short-patch-repair endonuclease
MKAPRHGPRTGAARTAETAETPAGGWLRARDIDDLIDDFASRQHGVVARAQLLAAGVPGHAIDHRLRRGRLRRIHQGVYGLGRLRGTYAEEMAGVLAAGDGALLSHGSAAALWGHLPPRPPDSRVEVSTPGRHSRSRPNLRTHRIEAMRPDEATSLHGIPITTPARTLLDLAAVLSAGELERALARALRAQEPPAGGPAPGLEKSLVALVERYPGRPGTPHLRFLLAQDALVFTRSHAEEVFLAIIERGGLPKPETNVRVLRFEVDCLFRAARLVVEIDGFRYHASPAALDRDRTRDQALNLAGYDVLRFTWKQLEREPDRVLASVAMALGRARGRGR